MRGGGDVNGLGGRCQPSDGRLVLRKANWLIAVNAVITHVWLGEVYDVGNKEEMMYHFEIAVGSFESFVIKAIIP